MGLYTKSAGGIYRFCLAESGIKRKDICDSTHYTKCIDDTIAASLGELNADYNQKYAVLLIDMQEYFLDTIDEKEKKEMISSQIEVLEYCAKKDIPAAILEFAYLGDTIDELVPYISKVPRRCNLKKTKKDGFTNPELLEQLNEWNVKNLSIMGILSSQCVKSTAESALKCGYSIATSNALIADHYLPYHKETIDWFKDKGKYYDDYKTLIKQIDLDTLYCK